VLYSSLHVFKLTSWQNGKPTCQLEDKPTSKPDGKLASQLAGCLADFPGEIAQTCTVQFFLSEA